MTTRETLTIVVLGDKVTLEVSAAARAHLEERVSLLDTPGACVSHLVQALAVCAAYPDSPREAASKARMSFSRWLAVVALSATEYSALGDQLNRARKALVRS